MTKNFLERQQQARVTGYRILPLMILAVPFIVAALYVCTILVWAAGSAAVFFCGAVIRESAGESGSSGRFSFDWWRPGWALILLAATMFSILVGSLWKWRQLLSGGRVIAESLGGRRINPGTASFEERRLLNVVEEMSIASGVAVPDVYVLRREPGLNAFVAGHSTGDMVVAVTEGAVKYLTRDQLQGVVAHEFSHVFSGDMRLNMRLMALVHGLFVPTLVSEWMMGTTHRHGGHDFGDKPSEQHLNIFHIIRDVLVIVVGFAVSFIGFNAAFFGRLIKRGVARQREYLADAAAVQFTRYPEGLASALMRAEKWPDGTSIRSVHAEEASHIFFLNGVAHEHLPWTETHPPVLERVNRIQNMMGPAMTPPVGSSPEEALGPAKRTQSGYATGRVSAPALPETSMTPGVEHIRYAGALLSDIPDLLKSAVHDPVLAPRLILAVMIAGEEQSGGVSMDILWPGVDSAGREMWNSWTAEVRRLGQAARLPLLEMAFPALRQMTVSGYRDWKKQLEIVVAADRQTDLFEFAALKLLERHLDPHFGLKARPETRFYALRAVAGDAAILFTVLARAGNDTEEQVAGAFERGLKALNQTRIPFHLAQPSVCSTASLGIALDHVSEVDVETRARIVAACVAIVTADDIVRLREGELLRAIAEMLDCPLPPLGA